MVRLFLPLEISGSQFPNAHKICEVFLCSGSFDAGWAFAGLVLSSGFEVDPYLPGGKVAVVVTPALRDSKNMMTLIPVIQPGAPFAKR